MMFRHLVSATLMMNVGGIDGQTVFQTVADTVRTDGTYPYVPATPKTEHEWMVKCLCEACKFVRRDADVAPCADCYERERDGARCYFQPQEVQS